MKKLSVLLFLTTLLIVSCSEESAIVTSEVSYDAAVLAVSVRTENQAYDESAEQNCGNESHYGLANLQVNVLATSDARSEDNRKVVAAGKTSNRGSIAFKDMALGTYTVEVSSGLRTIQKTVVIKEIKRVAVIMEF